MFVFTICDFITKVCFWQIFSYLRGVPPPEGEDEGGGVWWKLKFFHIPLPFIPSLEGGVLSAPPLQIFLFFPYKYRLN